MPNDIELKAGVDIQPAHLKVEKGLHLVNENYRVENELLDKPLRKRFSVETDDKKSFIDFIQEYKTDATKIFYTNSQAKAIFDFATVDEAKFAEQSISLNFKYTSEYSFLASFLNRTVSQRDFIKLLKTLYPHLAQIDGVNADNMDVIELAENLQAVKKFDSVQRNASSKVSLEVEIKSGAKSSVEIPKVLTFSLPIYTADKAKIVNLDIELFVNIDNDGNFGLELIFFRKDEIEELILDEIVSDIVEETQGIKSFKGSF